MNNRDQLDTLWGDLFTAKENAERPAEPMYRATQGKNFGGPCCFYDYGMKKLLLNPEYGGDGKIAGRCNRFDLPIVAFPSALGAGRPDVLYGSQFPAKYKGGAFIALHGSWNRAPMPMDGYDVTFQPSKGDEPSGQSEIFANGIAGADPLMSPAMAGSRRRGCPGARRFPVYQR